MIAAAIGPIFTFLDTALKRAFPDKTERDRIQGEIERAVLAGDLAVLQGQLAVNLAEAQNEHLFVSGWRPFVGWTCGSSLAWAAVLRPMLEWTLSVCGVQVPPLPNLAAEMTTPILGALLGIGGMRTFEKIQGANKRR